MRMLDAKDAIVELELVVVGERSRRSPCEKMTHEFGRVTAGTTAQRTVKTCTWKWTAGRHTRLQGCLKTGSGV